MSAPIKTPIELKQLYRIARTAGDVMRNHFTHFGIKREIKSDLSPVTKADKEINNLVIKEIREISAEIDIVAEEKSDRTKSPWQIVCDPIDGTLPYTWGMPVSTFMIGLLYEFMPIMGVIYDPFFNRMYYAQKGWGASMDMNDLRVSRAAKRKDAPIVGYISWPKCKYNILKVCQRLEKKGITLVHFMSIGYMEAAVATGEFAATLFPGKQYYDTAPGHIIIEEAGGKVTDIFGEPLDYSAGKIRGHICSNGKIHDLIVEAVRECN